jgi:hypothetical protein
MSGCTANAAPSTRSAGSVRTYPRVCLQECTLIAPRKYPTANAGGDADFTGRSRFSCAHPNIERLRFDPDHAAECIFGTTFSIPRQLQTEVTPQTHGLLGLFEVIQNAGDILVSRAGLEPATTALKVRCSTN